MLLASQTTAANPTVWVCHAAIAERLRCSTITVKRAIQKLVEAKLLDETGDLHERRYKFYRVRWNVAEPKKENPIAKVILLKKPTPAPATVEQPKPKAMPVERPAPIAKPATPPPPRPPIPTLEQMPKDGGLAKYVERAQLMHEEYLRRYQIKLF